MPDTGVIRPNDEPIPDHIKRELRRRADSIPPRFLYAAGLTLEEVFKIRENVPITWNEYNVLLFKVARAEALQQEERAITNWEWQISQQQEKKIPSWLPIMFGVTIFLLITVFVLRRT